MRIIVLIVAMLALGISAFGGQVGLPQERLAMPKVEGDHLVCIWDQTAGDWLVKFERYDQSGVYEFQVPEWGKWYWVGLWNKANESYVYGKWIGHFPVNK